MSKSHVTDLFIYRYRYTASYVILGVILLLLLLVVGTYVPGGISSPEMQSATVSGNLQAGAVSGNQLEAIVNLPYHALQMLSFTIFGVTELSIKLPSLALATLSVGFLFSVLRLWFRRNVAIITSIIAITSSQFLLIAQSGEASILYFFWGTLIVLTASMMANAKALRPLWLVLTALSAGLALYTPFMLYVIIPLVITMFIHPHARFVVLRQPLWAMLLSGVAFVAALIPLFLATIKSPNTLVELLLGTHDIASIAVADNVSKLTDYVNFINSSGGVLLHPAFGLGILLLATLGLVNLLSAKYTAKSYILTIWLILMIPVLLIQPELSVVALLPIVLLSAFAVNFLIRNWYTMFPLNPYARVIGLIPLGILVTVLSLSSMDRFIYSYRYDPVSVAAYSNDLSILTHEISQQKDPVDVFVTKENEPFYKMVFQQNELNATARIVQAPMLSSDRTLITVKPLETDTTDTIIPTKTITADTSSNANRFYLYEKTST